MPHYIVTYHADASPEGLVRASRGDTAASPKAVTVKANSIIAAVMEAEKSFPDLGLIPRIVAVEEICHEHLVENLSDQQLTELLTTPVSEYEQPLIPEDLEDIGELYQDTSHFLSVALQIVEQLRGTGLVPGLHLSLLGQPEGPIDYTMIEIYDEARGHYVSKGCEIKHLTDDRSAKDWDAVLALVRGWPARPSACTDHPTRAHCADPLRKDAMSLTFIETTSQIPTTARSTPVITVFGPEQCPRCENTLQSLRHWGLGETSTKQVITAGDPDHTRFVEAGAVSAPIVQVEIEGAETLYWTGHRIDLLLKLSRIRVGD